MIYIYFHSTQSLGIDTFGNLPDVQLYQLGLTLLKVTTSLFMQLQVVYLVSGIVPCLFSKCWNLISMGATLLCTMT